MFLTPDGRPFYGGTYFPNEDRHGMPAFARVLRSVADAWHDQRDDVEEQARQLTDAIDEHVAAPRRRAIGRSTRDDPRDARTPTCARSSTPHAAASGAHPSSRRR